MIFWHDRDVQPFGLRNYNIDFSWNPLHLTRPHDLFGVDWVI